MVENIDTGGYIVKKSQKLVNIVCEWPLISVTLCFFFVSNSRYALHNECFGQIPDKRGCAILYCFVILITIRQRSNNQHKMLIVKSSWRNFLYTILAYFRTSSDTLWIRKKESPLTLFKNKFYFLGKSKGQ